MPRDDEIIADFPAYALGALDEDEQQAVEELVARDVDAADELSELLETVADMSARIGEVAPPESLRQELVSIASAETSVAKHTTTYSSLVEHLENRIAIEEVEYERDLRTIWDRLGSVVTAGRLAFATSVASFAIVGIMAVQLGADNVELNRKVSDMEREVAAAYAHSEAMVVDMSSNEQLLTHAHERISKHDQEIVKMNEINDALRTSMNDQISLTYATLRNEYQSPAWQPEAALSGDGYAYLLEHQQKPIGALVIGGVDQAPAGEEYRLYFIDKDEPTYIASFDMNEAGYSTVLFELELPLSLYNGAHITRERIIDAPDPSLALPENPFTPQ